MNTPIHIKSARWAVLCQSLTSDSTDWLFTNGLIDVGRVA